MTYALGVRGAVARVVTDPTCGSKVFYHHLFSLLPRCARQKRKRKEEKYRSNAHPEPAEGKAKRRPHTSYH